MPACETYLLHLYRSRAVSGWQWAARLQQLPAGESARFRDPEALLAYLRAVVGLGEHVPVQPGASARKDSPATRPENNVENNV
jgi:hypothetical protein